MLLPMEEPWNQLELISTGGTQIEAATDTTPASDAAWVINVRAAQGCPALLAGRGGCGCSPACLPAWPTSRTALRCTAHASSIPSSPAAAAVQPPRHVAQRGPHAH